MWLFNASNIASPSRRKLSSYIDFLDHVQQ